MVDRFLRRVERWAESRPDVDAVVLVGSHARDEAGLDSDVDLVILTPNPTLLLKAPGWLSRFGRVKSDALEDYGRLVSRRVTFESGLEVEFGIAQPEWASDPDEGTCDVLRDGFRVVFDRQGIFARLRLF